MIETPVSIKQYNLTATQTAASELTTEMWDLLLYQTALVLDRSP